MQKITFPTLEHYQKIKSKHAFEFQEVCSEMEEYFGKKHKNIIWTLPYRIGFTENKLRNALEVCKRKRKNSVLYLIGIVKRL